MKTRNKLLSATCSFFVALTAATAQTVFIWKGGSGVWSDAANWTVGGSAATRAPGCDASVEDDVVQFDPSGDATVEVDRDVKLFKMVSAYHSDRTELPVLTLTGGHKITMTANENSASVRPRFQRGIEVRFGDVEIDTYFLDINDVGRFCPGSSLTVRNTLYLFAAGARAYFLEGCRVDTNLIDIRSEGCTLVFDGGEIAGLDGGTGTVAVNASGGEVVVNGGYLKMRPSVCEGSAFRLRGGVVDSSGGNAPGLSDATFEFTGGTLRTQYDVPAGDTRYFGGKDTVLDCLSANLTAIRPLVEDGAAMSFGGTLYMTNRTSSSAPRWTFPSNAVVTGRGKVFGGSVWMSGAYTVDWDLDTLALGGQFYQPTSARCVFGDDLTLRPYGNDWSSGNWSSTIEIGGKVKADTLDCKDGSSPRTIRITRGLPRPGTSLEVTGGGVFEWKQCDVVRPIREVVVREGSTLRLYGPISASGITLEANARIEMLADSEYVNDKQPPCIEAYSFTIDPTATIAYKMPASPAEAAYPLVSRPDGGDVSDVAAKIVVDTNGSSSYTVRTSGSVAFLWNGTEPESTFTPGGNQYLWTGSSTADDKWTTADNWYSSAAPGNSADALVFIGGTGGHSIDWNGYSTYRTGRWKFLPDCGPVTVTGNPVHTLAWSSYNSNPNFISESRFPVVFGNGLTCSGNRISIAASNSYVTVLGPVTPKDSLYVCGDVRFGGQSVIPGEFNFFTAMSGGRESRLEILPGGSITVNANKSLYSVSASIVVNGNANLTYAAGEGNVYGWNVPTWVGERVHVIDGGMSVMCPLAGGCRQRYRGKGNLHVETTRSDASGDCEVNIGGGISFTSGGFSTVTADAPDNHVKLSVTGAATLRADKPWTYGPAAGVTTSTTVDDRALEIRECATLTVDTPVHALTLADPIRGKGGLKFAPGAKLALDERLPRQGGWVEIATVGAVEGEPDLGRECRFASFPNSDGTVTFMARPATGTVVVIR